MLNFKYKARDAFSRLVTGTTLADSADAASKKLQELGYVPISIQEVNELSADELLKHFQGVKFSELNAFTRQLYSLQKAGLPLLMSLESVGQQVNNMYFKAVIEEVARDIRGGLSFSASIKKHPRVFDAVYVSMIKAAETGGNLVAILERLTVLIEQDIDTRNRIRSSTQYPMLAFFTICIGFLIVVTFVIPRFAVIYNQFNAALPLPTRILIFIGVNLQKFWYVFIAGVVAAVFFFRRFIHSSSGRPLWDTVKIRIPIIGPLVTMLIMSRFARVTGILMKSGVPILEVLDLVGGISGNVIIERSIKKIRESVNQGKGMSEPMKISGLFPLSVVQMVAVGEQTGRVDELLSSVADYYDTESGYMIKNLTSYIEPVLIFVLGIMVLVMALAIFMPMWNLIKIFKPS